MSEPANKIFKFGPYRLDTAERVLLRDGRPLPLTLKAFEVLLLLVENCGHIVEKDELMNRVWAGSFVEEGNLKVTVSMLRKVLEDNHGGNRLIETVPRRGYRFVANVREISDETADLVIHERTRERLTIEERTIKARPGNWRWPLLLAGVMIVLLSVVVGFLAFRRQNQPMPAVTSAAPIKSIAVLPFKPLAANSRDESLELGMADTLITRLSGMTQIVLRPTSAVRQYSDPQQDPLAAGRDLKVDAVLDGNIQKSGGRVRITVRLLRTDDGSTVWANRFDESFTDIFAVQDSISEQVTRALLVKLSGVERERLAKHYTDNPEAYKLYLTGRYFWNKRTEDGYKNAVEYFRKAIEQDSRYGLAYAGLASSYDLLGDLSSARAAAMKALEIDDTLADAHESLAVIMVHSEWDFAGSEREFKRALELDPNSASAHQRYGHLLAILERFDESIAEEMRASELDPLSLGIKTYAGITFYFARQYDRAIEQYRSALQMDEKFALARSHLAEAYVRKKMYREAIEELQKGEQLAHTAADLGYCYAVSGESGKALKILDELKEKSKKKHVPPTKIAQVYIGLGRIDQAFEWLERAYEQRDAWLLYLKVDALYDSVRSDPRFANLVRRVGLW